MTETLPARNSPAPASSARAEAHAAPSQTGGPIAAAQPAAARPGEADRLPILIAPHPMLKARARPVTPGDAETVRAIVPRMFDAMYAAPGIGLAAPQIGLPLRLVVIDLQPDDKPAPLVLVNPEIVARSSNDAMREEGCLSLPGQYADVTRPARVQVRYHDADGKRHEIDADGLMAACLQHEIDHLDGVLFVDHLSVLKRNMIMRRLAKEQRQKAK